MEYTIYLDIDGVLADLGAVWDYYKGNPGDKSTAWTNFVKFKEFEKLPLCYHAEELMEELEKLPVNIELLGSLGGHTFASEIQEQKIKWLRENNITYKQNFVVTKSHKQKFAGPYKVLIDDNVSNVEQFNYAGGYSILYKDENCKKVLKEIKRHMNI